MGTDASLFTDDGQKHYYDREYNISAWHSDDDWMRDTWGKLLQEGIDKETMVIYLLKIRQETLNDKDIEAGEDMQYRLDQIEACMSFVKKLSPVVKITSRPI